MRNWPLQTCKDVGDQLTIGTDWSNLVQEAAFFDASFFLEARLVAFVLKLSQCKNFKGNISPIFIKCQLCTGGPRLALLQLVLITQLNFVYEAAFFDAFFFLVVRISKLLLHHISFDSKVSNLLLLTSNYIWQRIRQVKNYLIQSNLVIRNGLIKIEQVGVRKHSL